MLAYIEARFGIFAGSDPLVLRILFWFLLFGALVAYGFDCYFTGSLWPGGKSGSGNKQRPPRIMRIAQAMDGKFDGKCDKDLSQGRILSAKTVGKVINNALEDEPDTDLKRRSITQKAHKRRLKALI